MHFINSSGKVTFQQSSERREGVSHAGIGRLNSRPEKIVSAKALRRLGVKQGMG